MSKNDVKSVKSLRSIEALKLGYTLGWKEALKTSLIKASASNADHVTSDYLVRFTEASGIDRNIIQELGGTIKQEWTLMFPTALISLPVDAAAFLANHSTVVSMVQDTPIQITADQPSQSSDSPNPNFALKNAKASCSKENNGKGHVCNNIPPPPWNAIPNTQFTWPTVALGLPELYKHRITGEKIAVVVLDTGINMNHAQNQRANLIEYRNFISLEPRGRFEDRNGHGTSTSGNIIAQPGFPIPPAEVRIVDAEHPLEGVLQPELRPVGLRPNIGADQGIAGTAPNVRFYMGRMLNDAGNGVPGTTISALEWVFSLLQVNGGVEKNVVLSMSYGGVQNANNAVLAPYYQKLYDYGVLMFASAGNTGVASSTFQPACLPSVIAVGGIDSNAQLSAFSTFGTSQELVAPATLVPILRPPGSVSASNCTSTTPDVIIDANTIGVGPTPYPTVTAEAMEGNANGTPKTPYISYGGKIAVIKKSSLAGTPVNADIVNTAFAAGASGVVVYNIISGGPSGFTGFPSGYNKPVSAITMASGLSILSAMLSGPVILTLRFDGPFDYTFANATSFCCPLAAGAAAAVWSAFPHMSNVMIRKLLQDSATDLGDHDWDIRYGYGLICAPRAIEMGRSGRWKRSNHAHAMETIEIA